MGGNLLGDSTICSVCLFVPCLCTIDDNPIDEIVVEVQVDTGKCLDDFGRKAITKVFNGIEYSLRLDEKIAEYVKPHQMQGIDFLANCLTENVGGILADYMGLGKTLQVIGAVHSVLMDRIDRSAQSVLVLCPTVCIQNWENECSKWLSEVGGQYLKVHVLNKTTEKSGKCKERLKLMKNWFECGGVLVMGYEMYRLMLTSMPTSQSEHKEAMHYLTDPGPDIVVLDEGHRMKDPQSILCQLLMRVKTLQRIVLTGYPIQNCLAEYWCMINFARPNYLNSYEVFRDRIEMPLLNASSSEQVAKVTKDFSEMLQKVVLRRSDELLKMELPPKYETVIECQLSKVQTMLYNRYLKNREIALGESKLSNKDVLGAYSTLLLVINHPDILYKGLHDIQKEQIEETKEVAKVSEWKASYTPEMDCIEPEPPVHAFEVCDKFMWAKDAFPSDYEPNRVESSTKMNALKVLAQKCIDIGDKLLVFSQSISSLQMIANMLDTIPSFANSRRENTKTVDVAQRRQWDPANSNRRKNQRKRKGMDNAPAVKKMSVSTKPYLQIDGSTPNHRRVEYIRDFNDATSNVKVMLLSTKAGAEGINLHAANRVVLFDVSWNPSHDHQSMCRSHRFGQTKSVHVYRFLAAGTIEQRILELQRKKIGLSTQIVDDVACTIKSCSANLEPDYFFQSLPASFAVSITNEQRQHIAKTDAALSELLALNANIIGLS